MKVTRKYNKGGKNVKDKLKQLERMPDSKGRKPRKNLPVIGTDRFDKDEYIVNNPMFSKEKRAAARARLKAKGKKVGGTN